jgi:hypothetical protein
MNYVRKTITALVYTFGCTVLSGCGTPATTQPAASATPPTAVDRGKYLVTIGGCNDCHTTKKMTPNGPELDTTKLLAGHPADMQLPAPPASAPNSPWAITTTPTLTAWSGPWGVSFAANLTPDKTGLGDWTEEMFVKAIRTGKHMGSSRPILPPMPWQDLSAMTDDDLKAAFAYLRSIPPVVNRVPFPMPPTQAGAQQ